MRQKAVGHPTAEAEASVGGGCCSQRLTKSVAGGLCRRCVPRPETRLSLPDFATEAGIVTDRIQALLIQPVWVQRKNSAMLVADCPQMVVRDLVAFTAKTLLPQTLRKVVLLGPDFLNHVNRVDGLVLSVAKNVINVLWNHMTVHVVLETSQTAEWLELTPWLRHIVVFSRF